MRDSGSHICSLLDATTRDALVSLEGNPHRRKQGKIVLTNYTDSMTLFTLLIKFQKSCVR